MINLIVRKIELPTTSHLALLLCSVAARFIGFLCVIKKCKLTSLKMCSLLSYIKSHVLYQSLAYVSNVRIIISLDQPARESSLALLGLLSKKKMLAIFHNLP